MTGFNLELPELMKTDEVAELLRCSKEHVLRMKRKGILPAAAISGERPLLFERKTVLALFNKRLEEEKSKLRKEIGLNE